MIGKSQIQKGGAMKTTYRFDWQDGHTIARKLSRSFDTLEQAQRFAEDKKNSEIYRSKGRYKVEWTKIIDNN